MLELSPHQKIHRECCSQCRDFYQISRFFPTSPHSFIRSHVRQIESMRPLTIGLLTPVQYNLFYEFRTVFAHNLRRGARLLPLPRQENLPEMGVERYVDSGLALIGCLLVELLDRDADIVRCDVHFPVFTMGSTSASDRAMRSTSRSFFTAGHPCAAGATDSAVSARRQTFRQSLRRDVSAYSPRCA